MSDILDIVLRDEENIATETVPVIADDSIAHYGRLGMKWYQHIYGDYQGAAKYAEKGARRVDRLQERGSISAAKRLRKKVDKFLSIAEKEKSMSAETKRKIAESINEHSSDKEVRAAAEKIKRFEETSKASDDIIDELRQDRINDLTRGVADWKNASSEDISAAITRLNLEKQYKEIRDDVSGAKVWKEAGVKALNSVAGSSGKILEEVVKTAGNIAEERNKADIATEKDRRTWAREDEKYERDQKDKLDAQAREDRQHERDRQEKLEDQAREDRNAELKGQRDVAKEEAKNRADYLKVQQDIRKYEDEQKDSSVGDVLEGRRPASSLTPKQAKNMEEYVKNLYGDKTTAKQVIDKYESDRQQKKATAETEEKAYQDWKKQFVADAVKLEQSARQQRAQDQKAYEERSKKQATAVSEMIQKRDAKEQAAQRRFERKNEKAAAAAAESVRKQREQASTASYNEMYRREAEAKNQRRVEKESALDFFKGLQDSQRTSSFSGRSSSGESINDRLSRNLAEFSKRAADSKAVADRVDTGSSLVDRILGRRSSGSSASYSSRNSSIKSFINNGGTYAEAEKKFNVSSSTISDILGHSAVPVFKRMSREEYYATYSGLKWKRS